MTVRYLCGGMTLLLFIASCNTSDGPGARAPDTPHAVQNAELRVLMLRMDALTYERAQTELELDRQRELDAPAIAAVAQRIAASAEQLSGQSLDLDADAQRRFVVLAGTLAAHSESIERAAVRHDYRQLSAAYQDLLTTCATCHSLFRDGGAR